MQYTTEHLPHTRGPIHACLVPGGASTGDGVCGLVRRALRSAACMANRCSTELMDGVFASLCLVASGPRSAIALGGVLGFESPRVPSVVFFGSTVCVAGCDVGACGFIG